MMISGQTRFFHGDGPLITRRDAERVEERNVDDLLEGTIPPRYRDGRGGIDLEQVRQDQLRARRQVVRAMVRRLDELWHRR